MPLGKLVNMQFGNGTATDLMVPETLFYNLVDIVFSPYGEHWRQLRRICMQGLLSTRPVRSFRRIREEENLNLCKGIASCGGSLADLSERIYLSTYDVVARAAVKAKTEEREMMISVVMKSLKLGSGFMLADLYPSVKLLPLITGARFKIRRMRRKLDKVLDGTLTTDLVKALLVDMFVAGTNTSTTIVEWAMSEMIRNPSKLNKAQEEVRKVFDEQGYIDEDKCEINGYEIPAGTRVVVQGWVLGRDPEYWNDTEKFIPERFEESSHDFQGSNLEYMPFGAGRRICPGMLFGLENVEIPLAMLLYHFDWKC
ncbi:salviol synthase-like [Salvia divinorum]|uniref:Salviol synthase-like n=1 Tax=Salvia divinorum TaxID=28513 RepID=A0ABD1G1P9_SALDI